MRRVCQFTSGFTQLSPFCCPPLLSYRSIRLSGALVFQLVSFEIWRLLADAVARASDLRRGWGASAKEVPGFAVFFEVAAIFLSCAFGVEADIREGEDLLDGNDVPGVVRDDVGDEEVDFVGGCPAPCAFCKGRVRRSSRRWFSYAHRHNVTVIDSN